jgi:hypothetical protein
MKLHRDHCGGPLGVKISSLIFFQKGTPHVTLKQFLIVMYIDLILFNSFMFLELGILKRELKDS